MHLATRRETVSDGEEQHIHGSGDLTPDVIRGKRFTLHDGRYDPEQVHEFLEQVASAMHVLQAPDTVQAMRRELQRNADISSRMVLAAQESADMLRNQAAEDARAVLDDTRRLAEQLRDRSRDEVERSRAHIDELRRTFVEELRDMYDRIGASLYRFESANRLDQMRAPDAGGQAGHAQEAASSSVEPAYRQLEERGDGDEQALRSRPADVGWDDEAPRANDEPLVDLRGFGERPPEQAGSGEPAQSTPHAADTSATPTEAVQRTPPAQTTQETPTQTAAGEPQPEAGGWLIADDAPADSAAPAADEQNVVAQAAVQASAEEEDRRAEALIAGMESVLGVGETEGAAAPLPEPPSLVPERDQGLEDTAEQLRAFILQAIHEGTPRDALEAWLTQNYGIEQPVAFVDHVLQTTPPEAPSS